MRVTEQDKLKAIQALKVGDRVRVLGRFWIMNGELDLHNDCATVTEIGDHFYFRLDDHYPCLDEWDNCVIIGVDVWLDSDDPLPYITPLYELTGNVGGLYTVSLPHGATGEYRGEVFTGALLLYRADQGLSDAPAWAVRCTLPQAQNLLWDVEAWDSNHYAEAGTQVPAIVAFVEGLSVFEETWGHPCDS